MPIDPSEDRYALARAGMFSSVAPPLISADHLGPPFRQECVTLFLKGTASVYSLFGSGIHPTRIHLQVVNPGGGYVGRLGTGAQHLRSRRHLIAKRSLGPSRSSHLLISCKNCAECADKESCHYRGTVFPRRPYQMTSPARVSRCAYRTQHQWQLLSARSAIADGENFLSRAVLSVSCRTASLPVLLLPPRPLSYPWFGLSSSLFNHP